MSIKRINHPFHVQQILLLFLIPLLIILNAYAIYIVFSSHYPGAVDFYPRWHAARALTVEGRNPYDPAVAQETQLGLFGRIMPSHEDQAGFAYPLYLIFFFYPLTFLPYPVAQAIWMAILQIALLAGVILCMKLVGWQPPLWLVIVTIFWSLFFLPATRAWMLGQVSILVFALSTLSLWALHKRHDTLAGIALATSTIKPHLVFLLIPLLLLYGLSRKRRAFIVSFSLSLFTLIGLAMLWLPSWPLDFLHGLVAYTGYQTYGSPLANLLNYLLPGSAAYLEMPLSLILLVLMAGAWLNLLRDKSTHPAASLWSAVFFTLGVSNLIVLRSGTVNQVMLFFPLFIIFYHLSLKGFQPWFIAGFQIIGALLLWVLFMTTKGNEFEPDYIHGVLPVFILGSYFLIWPNTIFGSG